MHTRVARFLLPVALVALLCVSAAYAQDVLPSTGRIVTDNADMLSDTEEKQLMYMLRYYADSTSTQIVIVTLPNLGGQDIAAYATELGQQWGVGQQGKDNGVVVLVSRDDRQVFIATGFGLEGAITDAEASRIIRYVVTPHFRSGAFYEGLAGAADALIAAAAGEFTVDERQQSASPQGQDILGMIFFLLFVIIIIIAAARNRRGDGPRPRRRDVFPVLFLGMGHHLGGSGGGFSGGGGFGGSGFGGGGFGGGGFGGGGAGGGW